MNDRNKNVLNDVTPNIRCKKEPKAIACEIGQTEDWVRLMMIDRQGEMPCSNMTTLGLHCVVEDRKSYACCSQVGLEEIADVNEAVSILDLEKEVLKREHDRVPKHVALTAKWGSSAFGQTGVKNVLGENVYFRLEGEEDEVEIPVIEAQNESLNYYGALLVYDNDVVSFTGPKYPIWKMNMGVNYIDGYIMNEIGGGFYLEWHKDQPHWHQPLSEDSKGYYILGKRYKTEDGYDTYHLTGFRIPYGMAVYTRRGAIHCDAGLIGKSWNMGYRDSSDFSTALIRNSLMNVVRLKPHYDEVYANRDHHMDALLQESIPPCPPLHA